MSSNDEDEEPNVDEVDEDEEEKSDSDEDQEEEEDKETEQFDALVKDVMEEEAKDHFTITDLPYKTDRLNPLLDLTDDQLVQLVEDYERQKIHLETENMVYERFLEENDPTNLEGMDKFLRTAVMIQDRTSISSARRLTVSTLPISKTASSVGSAFLAPGKGYSINLTQKTDLVLHEIENIQLKLTALKKRSHIKKSRLKAELEEMAIRESELSEALNLFEVNIVIGAVDMITQRIPADKFVRFVEEWLKSARRTIDKLRLRTSSLKIQYQKVSHQLTQKQLLGENLQEVDFEQLQIENKHLIEKYEQKTLLLIELKRMNGTANLALNDHKKLLKKKQEDIKTIEEMIRVKEEKIDKLDGECEIATDEVDEEREKLEAIKEKVQMYRVPDVLEYVRKKAELSTLRKNVRAAARTKQIKEMALMSCVRELKSITGKKVTDPTWFIIPSDSDMTLSEDNFQVKSSIPSRLSSKRSMNRSKLLLITKVKK